MHLLHSVDAQPPQCGQDVHPLQSGGYAELLMGVQPLHESATEAAFRGSETPPPTPLPTHTSWGDVAYACCECVPA